MKKLVIHIGYPKTGTTSAQINLFWPLHREGRINYLGNHEGVPDPGIAATDKFLKTIVMGLSSDVGLHERLVRDGPYLNGLLEEDRVSLWSSEYLTVPGIGTRPNVEFPAVIKQAFGEKDVRYKIVVTMRNPIDLLSSFYAHFYEVWYHNYSEKDTLDKWVRRVLADEEGEARFVFDFKTQVQNWVRVFGEDAVHLLFFEDMKARSATYANQWSRLLDLDSAVNPASFSREGAARQRTRTDAGYLRSVSLDRIIRRKLGIRGNYYDLRPTMARKVFWGGLRRLGHLPLTIEDMSSETRDLVLRSYEPGNRFLAEAFGLDTDAMDAYGYFRKTAESAAA